MRKQRTRPGNIGVGTFIERARLVRETAGDQAPEASEVLQAYEAGQPAQGRIGTRLARRQIEDLGAIFGDDQHFAVGDGGDGNTDVRPLMRRLMVGHDWCAGGEHRDGGDEARSPSAGGGAAVARSHRSSLRETRATSVQRPPPPDSLARVSGATSMCRKVSGPAPSAWAIAARMTEG